MVLICGLKLKQEQLTSFPGLPGSPAYPGMPLNPCKTGIVFRENSKCKELACIYYGLCTIRSFVKLIHPKGTSKSSEETILEKRDFVDIKQSMNFHLMIVMLLLIT